MITGFSEERVRHALDAFGGDKNAAMNMLFG